MKRPSFRRARPNRRDFNRKTRRSKRNRRRCVRLEALEPRRVLTLPADALEPNDAREAAVQLGAAPGVHLDNLTLHDGNDEDWYRLRVPRAVDTLDIGIEFSHAEGNLSLEITDDSGAVLAAGRSSDDNERVTLDSVPAGALWVHVFGEENAYSIFAEPGIGSAVRTFYVNDTDIAGDRYALAPGDDSQDGADPATPKRTLQSLLSDHVLGPNDRVLIDTGQYSGPVTLTAADEGAAYLGSPVGSRFVSNTSNARFDFVDSDFNLLEGLEITGANGIGIRARSSGSDVSSHNTFRGNAISLSGNSTGIRVDGGDADEVRDNTIAVGGTGVDLNGVQGASLTGNTIHADGTGIRAQAGSGSTGSLLVDGNVLDGGNLGIDLAGTFGGGATISHNEVRGFTNTGIRGGGPANFRGNDVDGLNTGQYGIQVNDTADVVGNMVTRAAVGIRSTRFDSTLRGNEIHRNELGIEGGGLLGGSDWSPDQVNDVFDNQVGIAALTGAEIRFNRVHGNVTGVQAADGVDIHHNVIFRNTDQGVLADRADNVELTNNTIYAAEGDGVHLRKGSTNVSLKNNIVWTESGVGIRVENDSQAGFSSDFNNLFSTGAGRLVHFQRTFDDIYDWQVESGLDANSIGRTTLAPGLDNPAFVDLAGDNFHLQPGVSTSLDAGNPATEYSQEPEPHGGRVNLGAYGNTSEAAISRHSFLEIEQPNFHTDWPSDQGRAIRWRSFNVAGNLRIDILRHSDGAVLDTFTVDASSETFGWSPEASGIEASADERYRVRLTSIADPAVTETSREPFSVPPEGNKYYVDDGNNVNDEFTPAATGNNRNTGKTPDDPKANLVPLLRNYDLGPGDTVYLDTGIYLQVRNPVISGDGVAGNDEGATFTGPADPAREARIDRGNLSAGTAALEIDAGDFVTLRHLTLTGGERGLWAHNSSTNILATDVLATANAAEGIRVENDAEGSRLNRLTATDNGGRGIYLGVNTEPLLEDFVALRNGGDGLYMQSSTATSLRNFQAENNGGTGLWIDLGAAPAAAAVEAFTAVGNDAGIALRGHVGSVQDSVVQNNAEDGLTLSSSNAPLVAHNRAFDNGGTGIRVIAAGARVESNESYRNREGIRVSGSEAVVGNADLSLGRGNVTYANRSAGIVATSGTLVTGNTSYGQEDGTGIELSGSSAAMHNVVHGNHRGISSPNAFSGTVRENRVYNQVDVGIRVTGGEIRGNVVYSNDVGVAVVPYSSASQASLANNLVYANASRGVQLTGGGAGVEVVNNTVYQAAGDAIRLEGGSTAVDLRNNILWADGGFTVSADVDSQAGLASNHNLLYAGVSGQIGFWSAQPRATLADWQSATLQDANSLAQDPAVVDPDGGDGVLGYASATDDGRDDDFHLRSNFGTFAGSSFAPVASDLGTGLPEFLPASGDVAFPEHSPAIDRGDGDDDVAAEPTSNGGYVNLGAYGNTIQASKSPPQYVLVTTPDGGQAIPAGQSLAVRWRSEDMEGTVEIDLLQDGATEPLASIASGTPNDGEFIWTIPDSFPTAANYRVRVTRIDTGLVDTSNEVFEITAPVSVFYVNDDTVEAGDWTTAVGDHAHSGLAPDSPLASIQAVLQAFDLGPGDTILVDAGVYPLATDVLITEEDSGVTIRGFNDPADATRYALLDRQDASSGSDVIELAGATDVTLDRLWLTGGYRGIATSGSVASDNLVVSKNVIYDNARSGVEVNGDDALLIDNTLQGNTVYGIQSTGNVATVSGNVVSGSSYGIDLSDGQVTANEVLDNATGIRGRSSVLIRDNHVHDNTTGISGGSVVDQNDVYANTTGISNAELVANNSVRGNRTGILLGSGDVARDNQTVYNRTGIAVNGSNATVDDNVVHGNETGISNGSSSFGTTISGNRVFDNSVAGILATDDTLVTDNHVYGNDVGILGDVYVTGYPRYVARPYAGKIRNNRVYDNGRYAVELQGGQNVSIVNNTLLHLQGETVRLETAGTAAGAVASTGIDLRNNVLAVGQGHAISTDTGTSLSSDYNLFDLSGEGQIGLWEGRSFGNLADWYYELGFDQHSQVADPQLVDPHGADDVQGFSITPLGPATIVGTRSHSAASRYGTAGGDWQSYLVAETFLSGVPDDFAIPTLERVHLAGQRDNFASPTEATSPSSALVAAESRRLEDFDVVATDDNKDYRVAHTFENLADPAGRKLIAATLELRIKAGTGTVDTTNDGLALGFHGVGPDDFVFSRDFSGLLGSTWSSGRNETLTLDLSDLPTAGGSTRNLISQLEEFDRLDVRVSDDTGVDYFELTLVFADPTPGEEAPTPSGDLAGSDAREAIDFDLIPGVNTHIASAKVAETFTGLTTVRPFDRIAGGTLDLRVAAGAAAAATDDALVLGFFGAGLEGEVWSGRFSDLLGGTWTEGRNERLTLDLAALPLAGGGTLDLSSLLEARGFLDVKVSDATGVDYFDLQIAYADYEFNETGDTSQVATWTFEGLDPGWYQIAATWQAANGNADDARYTVGDDGTILARVDVDQRQAPAEFTDQGFAWDSLGNFHIASDKLVVQLASDDGRPVLADALRIVPIEGDGGPDDDLHLEPDSPAVDAGDPASAFSGEPAPHGGRANLGAFGNSAEGTSSSPQIVQVLSPNRLEKFETGNALDIRWRTHGFDPATTTADLELLKNGVVVQSVVRGTDNDGQFTWILPAGLGESADYRVRVIIQGMTGLADTSDGDFLIANGGTDFYVNDDSAVDDLFTVAPGNNGASGKRPDAPMSSLSALLQAYDLEPGDVVHVDTGNYPLLRDLEIQSEDAGVTLEGPSGGRVAMLDRGNSEGTVLDVSASGVTVNGLQLTGGNVGVASRGDDFTLRNSRIFENGSAGIENSGARAVIDGNTFSGVPSAAGKAQATAISVPGPDATIANNHVLVGDIDNGPRGTVEGNRISHGAITVDSDGLVRGNEVASWTGAAIRIVGDGVVVEDNVVAGGGSSAWGIRVDGDAAVVRANTASGFSYGVRVHGNSGVVQANRLFHNRFGVYLNSQTTIPLGTQVVGNRIFAHEETGIAAVGDALVAGNAVYDNSVGISTAVGNLYPSGSIEFTGAVRNNLVYNNQNQGILVQSAENAQVANNTLVQEVGQAVRLDVAKNTTASADLRNNILSVGSGAAIEVVDATGVHLDSDYNVLEVTGGGIVGQWEATEFAELREWSLELGVDSHSLGGSPSFTDPKGADDQRGYSTQTGGTKQIVNDGDAGFSVEGVWTVVPGGRSDSRHVSGSGNPADVARWEFTGLPPGWYQVAATWSGDGATREALYTLRDGTALAGSAEIDQRLVPDDFRDDGSDWEQLGLVEIRSGSLQVELSSARAALGVVVADAVRIQPVTGDGGVDDLFTLQASSPAIDRGDPASAYANEPRPNGLRVNVGAYGNTTRAAASPEQLVQVLAPNGLEKLEAGESTTIRWRSAGLPDGATADVEYSADQGVTWTAIATGVSLDGAGQGELSWTPPEATPGTTGLVRVTAGVQDQSDRPFLVAPSGRDFYVNDGSTTGDLFTTARGDNRNHGKAPAAPLASVSALMAAYDLGTGDVIHVDAGTYTLVQDIELRERESGITIQGAMAADGSLLTLVDRNDSDPGDRVFDLLGADDVTLARLRITGGEAGVYAGSSADSDRLTVTESEIFGNGHYGIFLDTDSGGAILTDNTVYPLAANGADQATGIEVRSSDTIIGSPTITDDGDSHFATTGTWSPVGEGFDGDALANNSGDRSEKASWTFAGLSPGLYRVSTTWTADTANNTYNAFYTSYDGDTQRWEVDVDQRYAPAGFPEAGADWRSLGLVEVTTGTLRVELSSNVSGRIVLADAVHIQPTRSNEISGNRVSQHATSGIRVTGDRSRVHDNNVSGNRVGIEARGSQVAVSANVVHDNSQTGISAGGDTSVRANLVFGHLGTNDVGIELDGIASAVGNTVHGNHDGISVRSVNSAPVLAPTIAENRVYGNSNTGIVARGATDVRGNFVYSNAVGIRGATYRDGFQYLGDQADVQNNLVYANSDQGIFLVDSVAARVVNNTILQEVGDALRLDGANAVSRNNILWVNSGYGIYLDAGSDLDSDRNLFTRGPDPDNPDPNAHAGFSEGAVRDTLAQWQAATGQDLQSLAGDPQFVDLNGADNILGYTTDSGGYDGGPDDNFFRVRLSPAIDRGDGLSAPSTDLFGQPRLDDPGFPNQGGIESYSEKDAGASAFAATGTAQGFNVSSGWFELEFPTGFAFPFYDHLLTSAFVSAEGFLQLETSSSANDASNTAMELAHRARIAPLWDNLRTDQAGDDVFVDDSVTGELTIRWNATNAADGSDVNFSVTLVDDGTIRFHYGDGNSGLTPTVGLSRGDGTRVLLASADGSADLANHHTLVFTPELGFTDIGAIEFPGNSADSTPPSIAETLPPAVGNSGSTVTSFDQIVLRLNEPVNPVDARALAVYELRGAGADKTFSTPDDILFHLDPTYVNSSNTITLDVREGPLPVSTYQLVVFSNASTSLHDLSGLRLDGAGDGVPGGNYVRTFRINSPPVATDDQFTTLEDAALEVPAGSGVLLNDIDADGDSLSTVLVAEPNHGTLNLNSDGSFEYSPATDYAGTDRFTYRASDGDATSEIATVLIEITPVNDPPLADPQTVGTLEDTPVEITLTGDDGDPQTAQGLTYLVASLPATGSLALPDGTPITTADTILPADRVVYTPAFDATAADSFTFQVRDDGGTDNGGVDTSAVAQVSIDVTATASPLVVTNTNDSGAGSLRSAMEYATSNAGPDTITFEIPETWAEAVGAGGAKAFVIRPTSELPRLSDDGTVIDGRSQAIFAGDTNPLGPEIVLDGSLLDPAMIDQDGLTLVGNQIWIDGLNIQNFPGDGVQVSGSKNWLTGNYIGTDATGRESRPNGRGEAGTRKGVLVLGSENLVGTNGDGVADASERNVISGNARSGIMINGAHDNVVAGNFIGVDASGAAPLGNGRPDQFDSHGVLVASSSERNIIGTNGSNDPYNEAERNVISGNGTDGVSISGSRLNVVAGNYLGTGVDGASKLGNGGRGVSLRRGATGNRVGTDGDAVADREERNVLADNLTGVLIVHAESNDNTIAGNYIGTDASGLHALGNHYVGVWIAAWGGKPARRNVIGTDGDGQADGFEGNLISGNSISGIMVDGGVETVVAGNLIGVDRTGSAPLPNSHGVRLRDGALDNRVGTNGDGTSDAEEGNTIAFNTRSGVRIVADDSAGNSVRGNSIHSNGELGIDLAGNGRTTNDPGDGDTGPNQLQNFPVLAYVESGTSARVVGGLDSAAQTTLTLDFYANETSEPADAEGRWLLGSTSVRTDEAGRATFEAWLPATLLPGTLVTATASDAAGNTSEFSQALAADRLAADALRVTTTEDTGPGSLRQALRLASAHPGPDTIEFAIPQSDPNFQDRDAGLPGGDSEPDVFVIQPRTPLPSIDDDATVLAGTTQTASGGETNAFGPEVVLRGTESIEDGLTLESDQNQVWGLNVQGFAGNGILVLGSRNWLAGNFIGTDATGTAAAGNGRGVRIAAGGVDNVVGSDGQGSNAAAERNLISGNDHAGVVVAAASTSIIGNFVGTTADGSARLPNGGDGISLSADNARIQENVLSGNQQAGVRATNAVGTVVRGNLIGTSAGGLEPLGNGLDGILLSLGGHAHIGGTSSEDANVIAANTRGGIFIQRSDHNRVEGNFIGTDIQGAARTNRSGQNVFGNSEGVFVFGDDNTIGGLAPGQANLISGNGNGLRITGGTGTSVVGNIIVENRGTGVFVRQEDPAEPTGARIRQNAISGNGQLAIDLVTEDTDGRAVLGVTPNDPGDADEGPNGLQNFPVLDSAQRLATGTRVRGRLDTAANSTFTVDLYANTAGDATAHGEASRWLGETQVTTDGSGKGTFDVVLDAGLSADEYVSATTTNRQGQTSELAGNLVPDRTPPGSQIDDDSLPSRATRLEIRVPILATDPVAQGQVASGVEEIDVWVTTDGEPFTLWRTLTAPFDAVFLAESNHVYGFRSVARDAAGNEEVKPELVEASIYVPDLEAPQTRVASVDSSRSTFVIDYSAQDSGGSGLSQIDVVVEVDGGSPQTVASLSASGSTVSGTITYQALADGEPHTYRFYSLGRDGYGNLEAPPPSTSDDQVVTATFGPPGTLAITAFDVQHAATQRSYIRFLDTTFNSSGGLTDILESLRDNDPSNDRIRLTRYDLSGNNGQRVALDAALLELAGQKLSIDFGAEGIGGNRNSAVGNGYYELAFDLDGLPGLETTRNFYRLFGDATGDRKVDLADVAAIAAAFGQSGGNLDEDINGDGVVNILDRLFAYYQQGQSLDPDLPLDD